MDFMQEASKPLSGIRVLDFSRFFAGPYCAQLLGDLGADVVKVESPGGGDPLRQQGPPFIHGNGITWYATNRNKRSITLDLRSADGSSTARDLCLKADVVIENFRPDIMGRMGLDYASLAVQAPRLVYASISGFGPDGPDAGLGAFDLTIQGVGGYMSITGPREGAPVKLGTSGFDMLAGMNCHSAILAALLQRERTGKGQHVTTSLLESEVAFLANAALEYLMTGQEPQKWGSEHAQQVPYKAFETSDGWAVIGAGFQKPSSASWAARSWRATSALPPWRGGCKTGWPCTPCWTRKCASGARPTSSRGWSRPACPARRSTTCNRYLPTARSGTAACK